MQTGSVLMEIVDHPRAADLDDASRFIVEAVSATAHQFFDMVLPRCQGFQAQVLEAQIVLSEKRPGFKVVSIFNQEICF